MHISQPRIHPTNRSMVVLAAVSLLAASLSLLPTSAKSVPVVAPGGVSSDLMVWLDAADPDANGIPEDNPTDGAPLTLWKDKSGLGNHATLQPGQNAGTYHSAPEKQINGNPTVHFTRVNDAKGTVFRIPIDLRPITTPDVTVFSVYRPSSKIPNAGVWGTDNGNWDRFYLSYHPAFGNRTTDGVAGLGPRDKGAVVPNAGIVGTTRLLTVRYNGKVTNNVNSGPVGASAVYFDGQIVRSFTDTADARDAQTYVGLGWDGDNSVFEGEISSFIIYKRALSQEEIEDVTEYLRNEYDIAKVGVDVTAQSPASLTYGHDIPTVGYTTNPATTASNWTVEPTCGVYASSDTNFTNKLEGVQPAGSYITHCEGGESKSHVVNNYINGVFQITKKPVEVYPEDIGVIDYGTLIPTIDFVTDVGLEATDWTTAPTCGVYDTSDTTFSSPLSGVQNVGTYIVHCYGGVSENYGPVTYIDRELQIASLDLVVSPVPTPAITFGDALPSITYTTDLGIPDGEWTTTPTCAVYALDDENFTTTLSGILDVGTYVTYCQGGIATNYPNVGYQVGYLEIVPANVTVTAESPNAITFGDDVTEIDFSSAIDTSDWVSQPICDVYDPTDVTFAQPLSGKLRAGSYVTQCREGETQNFHVNNYVTGTLVVNRKAVVVSPVTPTRYRYGIWLSRVDFSTGPVTTYDDWTSAPICSVYAQSDTALRKPLSGKLPSGRYVTACRGGSSSDFLPASYRRGTLEIIPTYRTKSITIYFDSMSANISSDAQAKIRAALQGRVTVGATSVKVHGYVQPTLNRSNDKTLSTARAHAVTRYLKRSGITVDSETIGRGRSVITGAKARKVVVTIRYSIG